MSDTKIKALKSFSDGVISMGVGDIEDVESTKASAFISGGLAEVYTEPVEPTGTIEITENGTYGVTSKASAEVAVPVPTGSQSITANGTYDITNKASVEVNVGTATVTYNANGGTGSIDAVIAIKGNQINLSDGTGLTAPEGKSFGGWASSAESESADISSPYTVTADVTIYAFWVQGE